MFVNDILTGESSRSEMKVINGRSSLILCLNVNEFFTELAEIDLPDLHSYKIISELVASESILG